MSDDAPSPANFLDRFGDNFLSEATGADSHDLQRGFIRQLLETLWLPDDCSAEDFDAAVNAAIAALMAIRPRGALEGGLAVQMVATHNAALGCLKLALDGPQTPYSFERLKQAEKLMGLYLRQFEAFNKHRGIGIPTVTVENVNVQAGGQAIVGHVQAERKSDRHEVEMQSPATTIDQKSVDTLDLTPLDPVYADARIARRGKP